MSPTSLVVVRLACFVSAVAFAAQSGAQPAFAQAEAEWTACPFETDGLDTTRLRCGRLEVAEQRGASPSR